MPVELIIVTGPPGAGKSTYARELGFRTFDQNLSNKSMWRDHPGPDPAVLVTAAPTFQAKQYWIDEAHRQGFTPRLIVVDPGRATAIQRVHSRAETENQRARLAKTVQRWYNNYQPHRREHRIKD